MRRVVVRPAAAADIEEAFLWYDSQLPGLGVDFREELRAAFARIVAAPELHQVIHRNTRRALLKRFPYGVFFCVFPDVVVVVAVMHARRNPKRWKSRS